MTEKHLLSEAEQRHLQQLIYDCQHGISPNPEFVLAVLRSLQAASTNTVMVGERLGPFFQIEL
jgi:hypothetical protein